MNTNVHHRAKCAIGNSPTSASENFAPDKLLTLGATYFIDDTAKATVLLDDSMAMLSVAQELINTLAVGLCNADGDMAANPKSLSSILYGVVWQIQMASNMTSSAFREVSRLERQVESRA